MFLFFQQFEAQNVLILFLITAIYFYRLKIDQKAFMCFCMLCVCILLRQYMYILFVLTVTDTYLRCDAERDCLLHFTIFIVFFS